MIFEEVQTRKKTGIVHLSDQELKKLIMSYVQDGEGSDIKTSDGLLSETNVKE